MEYFVADSYKNYEKISEPFPNDKGTLYIKVRTKCDRCSKGVYVCRVENGQPVPHPAYGGVCLKCGSSGILEKTVRAYTKSEYIVMQRRKERITATKEEKRQKEFEMKKAEWIKSNGFSEDGFTYVVTGDSYSIKEELKAAGFRYDNILKWHAADPGAYADRVEKFSLDEIIEFSAWGTGYFKTGAVDLIEKRLTPESNSEYIEGEDGKIYSLKVKFVSGSGFSSHFGFTHIYKFSHNDNILTWFTQKDCAFDTEHDYMIDAAIKEHREYKGEKQTVITRAKVKEI